MKFKQEPPFVAIIEVNNPFDRFHVVVLQQMSPIGHANTKTEAIKYARETKKTYGIRRNRHVPFFKYFRRDEIK